jgi:protein TonB
MQSDAISWSVAILLSLLVHGMMLMQKGAQMGAENSPASEALHITRLNFSQVVEKPVLDEPRPIEKPPAKPAALSRPKPVGAAKKVQPLKRVEKTEPVRQTKSPPQVQGRKVSKSSDGLLQAKRQQYLHELLSHIESFKYYPRAARRRSIEGSVNISFILRDDGHYEQLELDGAEAILVNATRQAMESAAPLPAPPDDIVLSDRVEFTMAYSLAR